MISKVVKLIGEYACFTFNLAIFGSGGLLGEQILLTRLIHCLNVKSYSGSIKIFLIDQAYKRSVEETSIYLADLMTPLNARAALGRNECFYQFLSEMSFILPPNIVLEGEIFSEADDYIARVQEDSRFKYDFLIGADPDGGQKAMASIKRSLGEEDLDNSIVLAKCSVGDGRIIAGICEVDTERDLNNCYPATPITRPTTPAVTSTCSIM